MSACSTLSTSSVDPNAVYKNVKEKTLIKNAEQAAANGKYSSASRMLEAHAALYPFSNRERRLVDSAYVYYRQGKAELSEAQCDLYNLEFPNGKFASYMNYLQGVSEYDRSSTALQRLFKTDPSLVNDEHFRNAFISFEKVTEAPYKKDAQYRMHVIRNIFARHQLVIANYYFNRGAYVAATNRARQIVQQFNGTMSVKPALQLMELSYHQLGMTDRESEIKGILKQGSA